MNRQSITNQELRATALPVCSTDLGTQADSAATTDTGTFSIVAFIKRCLQNWTTLLAKIPALVSGRVPVDGSGVTQPVNIIAGTAEIGNVKNSGTFAVQATQAGAWAINANAGTNLNTSALALESGGNLASLSTNIGAQSDAVASTDTGSFGVIPFIKRILQNWTTLIARTPVLVSGRIPTDGSGVTQPVSGIFWQTTQPISGNIVLLAGTAEIGNVKNSGTFATQASQSGTWTIQPGNTANTTPWLANSTTPYPNGANPITAASGNVANATATATLSGTSGKTTYITGFTITSGGATLAATVNPTVTGTISGTLTYSYQVPALSGMAEPLVVPYPVAIPASGTNTSIVVTLPSLGSGNANATVVAYGYQL